MRKNGYLLRTTNTHKIVRRYEHDAEGVKDHVLEEMVLHTIYEGTTTRP